jgi:hypothetical protein
MKKFIVRFEGQAIIGIDNAVIAAVDDYWRSQFYDLHDSTDIAEHIAVNLVLRRVKLSYLDGWADQPDDRAVVLDGPDWETEAFDISEFEEIPDEAEVK